MVQMGWPYESLDCLLFPFKIQRTNTGFLLLCLLFPVLQLLPQPPSPQPPDGLSMHGGASLPLPPTQGDVCQGPRQPVHQGVHKTSLSTTGLPLAELVRNVVVKLVLTKLVLRRELVLLELVWLELILLELILLKLVLLELVLLAEAGLKLLLSSLQWELLDKLLPTVQELLPAGQDLDRNMYSPFCTCSNIYTFTLVPLYTCTLVEALLQFCHSGASRTHTLCVCDNKDHGCVQMSSAVTCCPF